MATPTFFSGCNFMMGLGKPKLYNKFEVALALAVAKILKGNFKTLGSSPSPGPRPLFPLGVILCALPLTPPNGGSISEFVAIVNKIQVQSNEVC